MVGFHFFSISLSLSLSFSLSLSLSLSLFLSLFLGITLCLPSSVLCVLLSSLPLYLILFMSLWPLYHLPLSVSPGLCLLNFFLCKEFDIFEFFCFVFFCGFNLSSNFLISLFFFFICFYFKSLLSVFLYQFISFWLSSPSLCPGLPGWMPSAADTFNGIWSRLCHYHIPLDARNHQKIAEGRSVGHNGPCIVVPGNIITIYFVGFRHLENRCGTFSDKLRRLRIGFLI